MASSNGGKPAARQARGGSGSGGAGTDRVAAKRRAPAKATKKTGGKGQNLESRLQQAEMLLSVSRRVAAIETLDEVLETLVEMTTWELGAERGTLFLNDPDSGELYSRVAQGNFKREIRILNTSGIAGLCFSTGEGQVIQDAYKDPHFNPNVDQQTGFKTKTILCAPVRTVGGEVIGVTQILNKRKGKFTKDDLALLEAMTTQATVALQSTQYVERMRKTREKELEFLDIVSDVTSELDLNALLQRVMGETARMLTAERATLFMNDTKTNELFSRVAMGESIGEIRLPNHVGIAGTVFTSGKTVNIPHAYADLRFSPAFDKQDRLLHPLHPVRAADQPGRQVHRRDASAEQTRRPLHRGGRIAPQGLHRASCDGVGELQPVRRSPADEELQREHVGKHVERRCHDRRRRQDRHL